MITATRTERSAIVQALVRLRVATASEIRRATGLTKGSFDWRVGDLVQSGAVVRDKTRHPPRYWLAPHMQGG
jgi:hypothetical protein